MPYAESTAGARAPESAGGREYTAVTEDRSEAGAEIVVRPARPEDREAVLAFCARIWDGHDYIAYVWDAWLADTRGALLVAIEAGSERPVGLVHVRMVSDDEAWMEGIRVDPDARRRGIARQLSVAALVAARARGTRVARLMISRENAASQQLAAGFGYAKVAEVVRYEAPALEPEAPGESEDAESGEDMAESDDHTAPAHDAAPGMRLIIAGVEDFERVWAWMERSSQLPLSGGLGFGDWSARALSEPEVRAALAEGRAWLLEEWETIQALALLEEQPAYAPDERDRLHLRTMDGTSEGIGRLALVLREEAGLRGLGSVSLWLPDLLILRDAMAGAGYEADGTPMWIYARELA